MCTDTDYCKDTPSYNRSEYEQWLNNLDKQNKYQLKDLAKRYSCEKENMKHTTLWTMHIAFIMK